MHPAVEVDNTAALINVGGAAVRRFSVRNAICAMPSAEPVSSRQLAHLFRYTRWANDLVLDRLRELGPPDGREAVEEARRLLSHLLRAQSIWWGRVTQSEAASLELWATDDLDTCAERSAVSTERWLDVVQSADDLTQPVRYQNTSGRTFENELQEIAHHVVNHSTHHRAQIAQQIRRAGAEPPATDYIFFVRDPDANPRHSVAS
jgi:uncharacterized damage-inducible protein DinB